MTRLFESGELRQFLAGLLADVSGRVEKLSEDELLSRSVDDMVEEFCSQAVLQPLMVGNDAVDGAVSETTVDVSNDFRWNGGKARGMRVTGTFELLWRCSASEVPAVDLHDDAFRGRSRGGPDHG